MKKVSMYPLLFALLALNPLQTKAVEINILPKEINISIPPSSVAFFWGSFICAVCAMCADDKAGGLISQASMITEDSLEAEDIAVGISVSDKQKPLLAQAKNYKNGITLSTILGVASFLSAGYLLYKKGSLTIR